MAFWHEARHLTCFGMRTAPPPPFISHLQHYPHPTSTPNPTLSRAPTSPTSAPRHLATPPTPHRHPTTSPAPTPLLVSAPALPVSPPAPNPRAGGAHRRASRLVAPQHVRVHAKPVEVGIGPDVQAHVVSGDRERRGKCVPHPHQPATQEGCVPSEGSEGSEGSNNRTIETR